MNGNNKYEFGELVDKIGKKLDEHIYFKIFLQGIPIVWASVVKAFKSVFFSSNGDMNPLGVVISIVACLVSLFFIVISSVADHRERSQKNTENLESIIAFQDVLLKSSIELKDRVNKSFENWTNRLSEDNSLKNTINGGIKPKDRIIEIVKQLSFCLCSVCMVDSKDLFTSAAIQINPRKNQTSNKWEWVYNPDRDVMSIKDLLSNKTTFALVANGIPFVYIHEKSKAIENEEYYPDKYDDKEKPKGSILCFELHEDMANYRAKLIITINTYEKKIIDSNQKSKIDWIVTERIKNGIVRQFEHEIKEELLWILLLETCENKKVKKRRN